MNLYILFLAVFASFAVVEVVRPRQSYISSPFWRTRGAIAFAAYTAVGSFAPIAWDGFLADHRIWDLREFPFWAQVSIGFLAAELLGYLWHRTMHASPFLWRWFHQMHHSAERVDIWGAFYFSPLDMLAFTFVGSLALVGIAGVGGEAGLVINVALMLLTMWQHFNIRTPRWLGYFVVRPEAHSLHHARGIHRFNYCDLPLIDMVFGTFRNPRELVQKAGFYDGSSRNLAPMLLGRNVSGYRPERDSLGARNTGQVDARNSSLERVGCSQELA